MLGLPSQLTAILQSTVAGGSAQLCNCAIHRVHVRRYSFALQFIFGILADFAV